MPSVGSKANILKVSTTLKKSLLSAGTLKRFAPQEVLFEVDQENRGVYLVVKGKVRMYVRDYPKLDRIFSSNSLLGVPSTFTGHPYSLGATATTAAEVVHVGKQAFLDLMTEQPELCREAADLLSREVTFIQAALAERRRSKGMPAAELAAR
jgi:CRP/FNR family transcriptional regulator, cyclic AMP receptor protein